MTDRKRLASAVFAIALACGLAGAGPAFAQTSVEPETVAGGLSYPWSVAFLPGGGYLVSERDGVLKFVSGKGEQSAVHGVPEVFAEGQGGLLDVVLSPDFAADSTVYLTYSQGSAEGAGTALFKARLAAGEDGYRLEDGETIFAANNRAYGGRHFGSRLAFSADGTLFMTVGERGNRPSAQDLSNHAGSVLRLTAQGKPAPGNPYVGEPGARPEIWSYGHRNPQSAAIHPETGKLWTVEHGARGGDEVNIPQSGKNYGWPVISYGRHYSGGRIGEGTAKQGMEQPVHYWDPSIAPSGMAFVTSERYPDWQGSLLVGALRGRHLARLELEGEKVLGEEKLLSGLGERIRDVRQGPDGFVYVLTDSDDGRLIRLLPQ